MMARRRPPVGQTADSRKASGIAQYLAGPFMSQGWMSSPEAAGDVPGGWLESE
jgi:hypothetical protein